MPGHVIKTTHCVTPEPPERSSPRVKKNGKGLREKVPHQGTSNFKVLGFWSIVVRAFSVCPRGLLLLSFVLKSCLRVWKKQKRAGSWIHGDFESLQLELQAQANPPLLESSVFLPLTSFHSGIICIICDKIQYIFQTETLPSKAFLRKKVKISGVKLHTQT